MIDRRMNKRTPAEFKVNYIHSGDYLISFSKDISVDGMFIYTENPPPPGDKIKLTLSFGDLPGITVQAEVVWINLSRSPMDCGMAVKFLDLSPHIEKKTLHFINRVAILLKKNKGSPADY